MAGGLWLQTCMRNKRIRWIRAVGTQIAETYVIVANIIFTVQLHTGHDDEDTHPLLVVTGISMAATLFTLIIAHLLLVRRMFSLSCQKLRIRSQLKLENIPQRFTTDIGRRAVHGDSALAYAILLCFIRVPGVLLPFLICDAKLVKVLETIEEDHSTVARLDGFLLVIREIPMLVCEIDHLCTSTGLAAAPLYSYIALSASGLCILVCALHFLEMVDHELTSLARRTYCYLHRVQCKSHC